LSELVPVFKPHTILCHNGKAQRDELISVALLLATALRSGGPPPVIIRREPTLAELADPDFAIVDCGLRDEPDLNNFDHHQLGPNAPAICSLTLVSRKLGIEQKMREHFKWFEFTELIDSKGPKSAIDHYNMGSSLGATKSVVEDFVIDMFEQENILRPTDMIYWILKRIGDFILNELEQRDRMVRMLDTSAKIISIGAVNILDVRSLDFSQSRIQINQIVPQSKFGSYYIYVILSQDPRNQGNLSFYRMASADVIDFNLIKKEPEVFFCHAGGFLVKTKLIGEKRIKQLVKKSLLIFPDL
jgi:hypothetical protein